MMSPITPNPIQPTVDNASISPSSSCEQQEDAPISGAGHHPGWMIPSRRGSRGPSPYARDDPSPPGDPMTDKSAFTDDEWHALTDAPLLVTMAIFAAGEHGPISMVKEASASARAIARPGDHGEANELIGQIASEAETKEARHDMKEHRGPDLDAAIAGALADLAPAAAALHTKATPIEAAEVA